MQKKIIRIVIISFVSFFAIVALTMYYRLGLYKEPLIKGNTEAEFEFIYIEHLGAYHEILESFEKVENFMRDNQLSCRQSIGHYLDNPEKIDPDRLRAHVGCLVSKNFDTQQFETLKKPSENPFKFKKVDTQSYLKIEFSGSPAVGPIKIYPIALKWFAEKEMASPDESIEVYSLDGENSLTEYYYPIKTKK